MATRNAIHILKNTLFPSQVLPSSTYLGEPLVNLGDGIMFFSGSTAGAPTWVPSGPSGTSVTYFEVGSNLYDLKIRNKITHYNGSTNLVGKFLSGSTNGFVLADIASIGSITNFTYSSNTLTITQSNGSSYSTTINDFTGLTITGPAYYQQNIVASNPYEIANVGFVTAFTANFDSNDTYVTGGTNTSATNYTNNASIGLKYNRDIPDGVYNLPYTDSFTTGATLNGTVVTFYRNDGTPYSIDLNSLSPTGSTALDAYTTGFTYNNANIITLSQNQGKADLTVDISTLASITVNGDVNVTGTTTTGNLIVNNPSGTTAIIGQGGLVIGSGGSHVSPGVGDLIVHGNFTVFGTGTTIATNELYIEDPTITLNYNPSGSSTSTSVGSGIIIQDGSGVIGTDTTLRIGQLYLDPNINSNTEYTSAFGNSNRGFFTQLNDIIIRNTNNNAGAPDGKRLIAEDDILDGGVY